MKTLVLAALCSVSLSSAAHAANVDVQDVFAELDSTNLMGLGPVGGSTDSFLVAGETFSITASGKWTLDNTFSLDDYLGQDGTTLYGSAILPGIGSVLFGTLMGQIGSSGPYFVVGSSFSGVAGSIRRVVPARAGQRLLQQCGFCDRGDHDRGHGTDAFPGPASGGRVAGPDGRGGAGRGAAPQGLTTGRIAGAVRDLSGSSRGGPYFVFFFHSGACPLCRDRGRGGVRLSRRSCGGAGHDIRSRAHGSLPRGAPADPASCIGHAADACMTENERARRRWGWGSAFAGVAVVGRAAERGLR